METKQNNQTTWIWIVAAGGVLLVLLCICLAVILIFGGAGFMAFRQAGSTDYPLPDIGPVATVPVEVDVVTPRPDVPVTPTDPSASSSDAFAAELPERDRYDLAVRFYGLDAPELPTPGDYQVGDRLTFYVTNEDLETTLTVDAALVYIADNVYMWVEDGVSYDEDALRRSADRFSQETVPTNRAFFGREASPGIDGDERLHVLHSTELGSWVAGYYGSSSEYPEEVATYSNEKEMFFINIGNTPPGSANYDAVLAHEYQHMIHWNVDANEESWVNEGLSELATYLNGFGPSSFSYSYLSNPDLQLNSWPEGGGSGANYGAGYLFVQYFLDRFGQDALRALVANPLNGFAGIEDTLEQIGATVTADEVFTDWTIANLLNDPDLGDGRYGYAELSMDASVNQSVSGLPHSSDLQQVYQYGVDYVALEDKGTLTVAFDGEEQTTILPANTANTDGDPATDDRFVWWANRGDESNPRLTRQVDLTGVDRAALDYDVWFWIEDRWDYGYLSVSTDGQRWEILSTPHTTTDDPHGNAYGSGYTGSSADFPEANAEGWLHESVDLSAYAGQVIDIRFEMITDDAVNRPGLAIDNICIDAVGWCDDAEQADDGWQDEGWLRHNNVLAQRFSVQVVVPDGSGGFDVLPMELDANNDGELTFEVPAGRDEAVLVISGLTRYTTEPAQYQFEVR